MKSKIYTTGFLVFVFVLTGNFSLAGQYFKLGFGAGFALSQADGDGMKGYNKLGINLQLYGGYAIDKANAIISELSYNNIGSKRRKESIPISSDKSLIEIDMATAGIMLGYEREFGDSRSSATNNRFYVGMKTNRIIEYSTDFLSRATSTAEDFVTLKTDFLSMKFGLRKRLIKSFFVGIDYEYVFSNIVEASTTNIRQLRPYLFSCSIKYDIL